MRYHLRSCSASDLLMSPGFSESLRKLHEPCGATGLPDSPKRQRAGPADETVCPTSLAVQGFAKLGGAGGFACRACFSHLLTLWVIWTVSGLVFITFLSAAGPLRQVRRRRGARTPACRVETRALLFDTECESCARTGRRYESCLLWHPAYRWPLMMSESRPSSARKRTVTGAPPQRTGDPADQVNSLPRVEQAKPIFLRESQPASRPASLGRPQSHPAYRPVSTRSDSFTDPSHDWHL